MLYRGLLITDLSGKIDGAVASHNRGGPYFRNHVVPTDPATEQQVIMRDGMAAARAAWVGFTEDERTAWENYARRLETTNRIGARRSLTGYQAHIQRYTAQYQRVNALDLGGTWDFVPPVGEARDFQQLQVTLESGNTTLRVQWDPDPMGWEASPDQDGFIVHLALPQPATINWFQGPFQPKAWVEGDPDVPITNPHDIALPEPYQPGTGAHFFWRIKMLWQNRPHGRLWQGMIVAPEP